MTDVPLMPGDPVTAAILGLEVVAVRLQHRIDVFDKHSNPSVCISPGFAAEIVRDVSYAREALIDSIAVASALQQYVNGVESFMLDSPASEVLANVTRYANAALEKARGQ